MGPQGYFGNDCSMESAVLQYGQQVSKPEQVFEYDFFDLPPITPDMLTHSVEVRVQASYNSSSYGYYSAAHPEILLIRVRGTPRIAAREARLSGGEGCVLSMSSLDCWSWGLDALLACE